MDHPSFDYGYGAGIVAMGLVFIINGGSVETDGMVFIIVGLLIIIYGLIRKHVW